MARMRFRTLFLLAALLFGAMSTATGGIDRVWAQEATPIATGSADPILANAMPENTAAYVATEFDPGSDQYLQLGALITQVVIPGAGDTVSSIVEEITQLLLLIPSDIQTVLEGEIGAAVVSPSGGGSVGLALPSYAVILHPVAAARARELVEDWFADRVEKAGAEAQKDLVDSTVVLRFPESADAESSEPSVVVFAGDYILFGNDFDSLSSFIDVIQGNAPALAESEEFQQLNQELPTERLMFGFVDGAALLDFANGLEVGSVDVESIDPPFGQTAFTLTADDVGLRLESVAIPLDTERELFDRNHDNPDFAAKVPESTLAMVAGSDLGESWAMEQLEALLLSTIIGSLGGEGIDLSDFDLGEQFGFLSMLTGINFKTDLIDQLRGDYGAALFSIDPDDPLASSAVIASELKTPDLVSVAVTSLGPLIQSSGAGSASVTTASIDDQTVNNVSIEADGLSATIQYGVVDDQIMIGLGDGIETVAVPSSTLLADSEGFQEVMAELPDSYDGLVYLDTRAIVEQVAPEIVESIAEDSQNAIIQCLTAGESDSNATPSANDSSPGSDGGWILDFGCSLADSLLGGDSALLDLVASRAPGPFAAVSYLDGDFQRVSGILMVGEAES